MPWAWSSVDCTEENGTRSENYSMDGITCEVTLRVAEADKNALVEDLMLNGVWPDPYLLYPPQVKSVVATGVTAVSPTTPDQAFTYSDYLVKVSYSTDEAEDLIAETLEPETEFFRLDHTWFRWKTDNAPLSPGEAPGLLVPKMKLTRQFYNRSAVPSALLLGGHVHNASYTSPTFGLTFAAQTLLLIPKPVNTKRTTAGGGGFEYGCSFLYNPAGWNKFLRANNYTFDQIIDNSGADYNSYTPSNLIALLV
jgi:hypothetical protein